MKKLMITAITGIALSLGAASITACGGKKKSPEALCKTIFEKRTDGTIKLFKKAGEQNKDAFFAHCEKLPMEYLKCEAKDIMKMEPSEIKECRKHMRAHQKDLNDVLVMGKVQPKRAKR